MNCGHLQNTVKYMPSFALVKSEFELLRGSREMQLC